MFNPSSHKVLLNSDNLDYAASDVYSFGKLVLMTHDRQNNLVSLCFCTPKGIILWELMTREDPYERQSPLAVAVAVIRDDSRPEVKYIHTNT